MRKVLFVSGFICSITLIMVSMRNYHEISGTEAFRTLFSSFLRVENRNNEHRRLASWPNVDGFTGNYGPTRARWPQSQYISWLQSESTETVNGNVPVISCPPGKYRSSGTSIYSRGDGQRIDGCKFCPRGYYGETNGLTSAACTGPCPRGRYRDQKGAIYENDCFLCPPGKVC